MVLCSFYVDTESQDDAETSQRSRRDQPSTSGSLLSFSFIVYIFTYLKCFFSLYERFTEEILWISEDINNEWQEMERNPKTNGWSRLDLFPEMAFRFSFCITLHFNIIHKHEQKTISLNHDTILFSVWCHCEKCDMLCESDDARIYKLSEV